MAKFNRKFIQKLDSKYINLRKKLINKLNNKNEEALDDIYEIEEMFYILIKEFSDLKDINVDTSAINCDKFNECLKKILKSYKII